MDKLNVKINYVNAKVNKAFWKGNDLRKAILCKNVNEADNEDDNQLRGLYID